MTNELTSYEPRNLGELETFSLKVCATDLVPQNYRRKPQDALVAMMYGKETAGLGPLASLNYVAVINGRPAFYGDSVAGIAFNKKLIVDMEESFEGKPYDDDFTAVCVVTRPSGTMVTQRFSVADAKLAGLWAKPGPWKQYPKRMLQWRARSWAIRDAAPHLMFGPTVEELADQEHIGADRAKDVTPQRARQPLEAPQYVELYDPWGEEYLVPPGEVEQWIRNAVDGSSPDELRDLAANNPDRPDIQAAVAAALPDEPARDAQGDAAPQGDGPAPPPPASEPRKAGNKQPDLQQRQATMIADELKAAPLNKRPALWMKHWPVIEGLRPKLRARLEEIRDEGAPEPERSFADEIDALEPDEWKKAEGRIEDARQTELLP